MAASGWFAARPSGTENIYKIYAESFQGREAPGRHCGRGPGDRGQCPASLWPRPQVARETTMSDTSQPSKSFPIPAGIPRRWRAAARHVAALALRHRRCGAGGVGVGRPPPRGRPELVAGAAAGSHGVWQLAVSIPVVFRRQRAPDQPGLADRGRTVAGQRLPGPRILRHRHRLRRGHPVQTPVARNGLAQLQQRRAPGFAARFCAVLPRPGALAGRLCPVPRPESQVQQRLLPRVAGRAGAA